MLQQIIASEFRMVGLYLDGGEAMSLKMYQKVYVIF